MNRFRFHRGSLEEALKTEANITDIQHLKRYMEESHPELYKDKILDIGFVYIGVDDRIGQEQFSVMVSTSDAKCFHVAGTIEIPLNEKVSIPDWMVWIS